RLLGIPLGRELAHGRPDVRRDRRRIDRGEPTLRIGSAGSGSSRGEERSKESIMIHARSSPRGAQCSQWHGELGNVASVGDNLATETDRIGAANFDYVTRAMVQRESGGFDMGAIELVDR